MLVDVGRVEVPIGKHRADVVAMDSTVIELQHSHLSPDEIREREEFYGKMVWIWDAVKPYEEERLLIFEHTNDDGKSYHTFKWKQPRKSIAWCTKPRYLDLGDGRLLRVHKIDAEKFTGWGQVVSKQMIIDHLNYGPNYAPELKKGKIKINLPKRLFPDTNQCGECGEPFHQPGLIARCFDHHVGGRLKV